MALASSDFFDTRVRVYRNHSRIDSSNGPARACRVASLSSGGRPRIFFSMV
jgi:hypothetical protein